MLNSIKIVVHWVWIRFFDHYTLHRSCDLFSCSYFPTLFPAQESNSYNVKTRGCHLLRQLKQAGGKAKEAE